MYGPSSFQIVQRCSSDDELYVCSDVHSGIPRMFPVQTTSYSKNESR